MADFHDGLLGSFEMGRKVGVSIERLRYWEQIGIVSPTYTACRTRRYRRYSQRDVERAVLVKQLVDKDKYSLEGAVRILAKNVRMDPLGTKDDR
jgi:DNA-binding transcriptional MerR regulator